MAELHATLQQRGPSVSEKRGSVDFTGGVIPTPVKGELHTVNSVNGQNTEDGAEPSEAEKKVLRRIGDAFPKSAYLIAVVELCERFTCTDPRDWRTTIFS